MNTSHRKKLIEVDLTLEAINKASVREKSIRIDLRAGYTFGECGAN
jgi:hypothetical protein